MKMKLVTGKQFVEAVTHSLLSEQSIISMKIDT